MSRCRGVASAALAISVVSSGLASAPAAVGAGASPPEGRDWGAHRPRFIPGELLVRFEPGTPPSERAALRSRHGLDRIAGLPLPGLELVRARGMGAIPEQAARVSAESSVRYAEPNHLWFPDQLIPDDPEFGDLWGLHNTGQTGGTLDADIDAPEGWDIAADSSGILVGVIDTGVQVDHPDLAANIWTNPGEIPGNGMDDDANGFIDDVNGWDFVNGDATVFDELDGDNHGTHVAGTIAAVTNNATDVAGVSQARIMPLKFLGPQGGTTADAISALDYAIDMGADLTNNSWGGGGFSQALRDKIEEANSAGQLFVAAAGNDGLNVDQGSNAHYPASYDNANIVAVAATTHTDGLASFSNFGATSVDLGAPGASILSTVPRFAKAVLTGPDTSGPAYRSAYHAFGLEGVPDAADRQALLSAVLAWMGVDGADPILVVDDDRGQGFQTAYTDALTALGFTNQATFTVPPSGACAVRDGPSESEMAAHAAIVWFTGDTFTCTLNGDDQSNLSSYLGAGAGRNLILFGQDIGFDLTQDGSLVSLFLENTLGADYIADLDLNFRLSAVPGTPYASVPDLELDDSQFFSSALAPRSGATAGLRGAPTTWFDGTSMATPHVTGAAAHVMARFPSLGNVEVKSRLMLLGDAVPSLAGKTVSGNRLNLGNVLGAVPSPPTNLTAAAVAGGDIDLAWAASAGPDVDGYRVYRDTTSGFPPSGSNLISGPSPVPGTTFTDTDTADRTTYFYVVRAEDTSGVESENSNEASATADATAPTVTSMTPADGTTGVSASATVTATFDEAMDPSTINGSTFMLEGSGVVSGTGSYDEEAQRASFAPSSPLASATTYTAQVTTGATDLAGNPLGSSVTWLFTTASEPPTPPPVPTCKGQQATIVGTSGDDELVGTPGDDVIVGLEGNDVIHGLSGRDLICAGDGDDLVRAGPHQDRVFGERGNDTILGQGGGDTLKGGPGGDRIKGGGGPDKVNGQGGRDILNGQGGADKVRGGGGRDRAKGGAGKDVVAGGGGGDILRGNGGDDTVRGQGGNDKLLGQGGDDKLVGGPGTDECDGGGGSNTFVGCEK